MKAILNQDRIVKIGTKAGVEIGRIPRDIGIERLRWNGEKLIDLASLRKIWVEYRNGAFILHAIQVPGSQLVPMLFRDRKRLINDNGVYRVKSEEEEHNEKVLAYRKSHYPSTGDQLDAILKWIDTLPGNKPSELQEIIEKWKSVKEEYNKAEVRR